jgi:hypothetical protein
MKLKIALVITLIVFGNNLHSQEIPTLGKLYDISSKLGVRCLERTDTALTSSYRGDFNYRLSEREKYLLKAAEFYNLKDYDNANLYSKMSRFNFRNKDLLNLSFVLLIGSYSNLKEIRPTSKYFYIAVRKKHIYPENMELIREAVRSNFSRSDFDDALSPYFYYHDRLRILQDIYPQ